MQEKDYGEIVIERSRRLAYLKSDLDYVAATYHIYREDPVQFINDWLVTYNPQITPSIIPFILFPRQEELIRFFHERNLKREDGVCEKCREVGFTWLAIAYAIYLWIFFPDKKISFGSRKEDLVDKIGDPDSIFEKMRLALRYLPTEYLPKDFDLSKDAPFMRIINKVNGSVITGESGDNIGRGGRSTLYFIDEAAFLEHPQKVEAALSSNSDCKIYISTPNGIGNVFYQKRHGGKNHVFTFNWYDDPRKDQAWFEKKKNALDSVIFAQEILIDYGASLEDVCIPAEWVKSAINFKCEGLDSGKKVAGLDVADEGGDANAFCIRRGSQVLSISSWREGNTTQTARKAYAYGRDQKLDLLCYDNIGVGAGIKGEFSSIVESLGKIDFDVLGVCVGSSPTRGLYAESKKNEDMFLNLKAQIWWQIRRRFEKTFEHISKIREHPLEELISIPNDNTLITELSQPRFSFSKNGKIEIESKESMRRRGVKSPNKADALILAFSPFDLLRRDPTIRVL